MPTIQDYINLVPSENQDKPNFIAVLNLLLAVPARVQELLNSMISLFDIDTPPVGDQLDIIGQWVGVSRNVLIPADLIYFSWDIDSSVGWDFGSWAPNDAGTDVTTLPDDAYLSLIRAKIAANQWDGTTDGAYAIWDAVFPQFHILIQDNQNMSYDLAITGGLVDSLTLALLIGGYIPLRPEGVQVNVYFVSIDTNKAFVWDAESALVGGWDEASWLREFGS